MALLYALSILCWWHAARRPRGPRVALVLAALLLAYPSYVFLFHRLASDAVYAAAFALGALVADALRGGHDPPGRAAVLGRALALLVLIDRSVRS